MELAKKYTSKVNALLDECLEQEKTAPAEDRPDLYKKNQMRIDRTILNYFKQLRPNPLSDDELLQNLT